MDRFIHGQNLAHYLDRLETETDPEQRLLLTDLLFEEVARFAARKGTAGEITALISRGRGRVAEQSRIIAQLECDGCDTALARRVLENMTELLTLFIAYRAGPEPENRAGGT